MAREMWAVFTDLGTLYAVIKRASDDFIWIPGAAAFQAIGTWDDARKASAAVSVTGRGAEYYSEDFPAAIVEGIYRWTIYRQAGGSPVVSDKFYNYNEIHWNGSKMWTLADAGFVREISEGDTFTNKTVVPWRLELRKKGTVTKLAEKEIFDVDGGDLSSIQTVIGRLTEV